MKIFNRKLIKGTNWALAGLLSLLGFSSCNGEDREIGVAEYGTPYADFDFTVSGKVTDTGGKALTDIRVVVPYVDHYQKAAAGVIPDYEVMRQPVDDTLFTDSKGEFEYRHVSSIPMDTVRLNMKFEDKFGNAEYQPDSIKVAFSRYDLSGGGEAWYEGSAKKDTVVVLKEAIKDGIGELISDNKGKITVKEGLFGTLIKAEGNCMPVIGPGSTCKRYPVKRTIHVYEYTKTSQAESKFTFFSNMQTKLVSTVECDEDGFFEAALPPGKYSVFVEENDSLYANSFDGAGGISPVTIAQSQ
jgi:putative lipoprotein (rSAM/lipoprotein system)